jgi:tRNA threonylcarbamoyladenosine biosynthesis protein TsaE
LAQTIIYQQLNQLPSVAQQIISYAGSSKIWLLEGPMAAGKTTLIKAICQQLGVTEAVASPTYSLVNEYNTAQGHDIYHFDFYRLRNQTEALDYGLYDYFDSGNLCLCEWPSKITDYWPHSYLYIKIDILADQSRQITLQQHP